MKQKNPDRSDQMVPMAVIGVSALFPGSVSTTGFWRDILAGADLITDVPTTHWLPEDYYDPDPEIITGGISNGNSYTTYSFPALKKYAFTVNVTF